MKRIIIKIIMQNKSQLTICIYHKPNDIYKGQALLKMGMSKYDCLLGIIARLIQKMFHMQQYKKV